MTAAGTWSVPREWVRSRPLLADSLLALALFVGENLLWAISPRQFWPPNWPTALAWGAAGMAAVAVRRRWPWLAVVAVSAHTAVTSALGIATEGLAILVVTYTVAAYLPVRRSAAATALMWLPGLAIATAMERYRAQALELTFWAFVAFNAMLATVCYLGGRIVFTRRRYVAALVERARAAEQNQQTLATRAVEDERRRIARELHDMVAHHVSVMGVLATGSRRMLRRDPDAADEALATIEETGRTTLREMRRLLGVLRTDLEPTDPLTPQPGLAGLAGLIEQVREAGLEMSLRTSGELGTVDPAVALTVYRIVQEALTNVLKHAGAHAAAEVRLDVAGGDQRGNVAGGDQRGNVAGGDQRGNFGGGDQRGNVAGQWLTLEVFDTGHGPAVRSGAALAGAIGHGLLGMQERVALFGGTLRTGPRPGGGFRVYARIPLEEGAAT